MNFIEPEDFGDKDGLTEGCVIMLFLGLLAGFVALILSCKLIDWWFLS